MGGMSDNKTEFSVGQVVVFPSQGVGKITAITDEVFKGEKIRYYNIYIEVSDTEAMIPVNRAKIKGIRAIVSAEEAEAALALLGEPCEPVTSDWKLRYQTNLDLLKKGSIKDIATIVRNLYNRSKIKELPILERKLYDSAKKLLEDEIAFSMGKSSKEVEELLHEKLEPLGEVDIREQKSFESPDDDDDFDDLEEGERIKVDEDDDSEDDDETDDSDLDVSDDDLDD